MFLLLCLSSACLLLLTCSLLLSHSPKRVCLFCMFLFLLACVDHLYVGRLCGLQWSRGGSFIQHKAATLFCVIAISIMVAETW